MFSVKGFISWVLGGLKREEEKIVLAKWEKLCDMCDGRGYYDLLSNCESCGGSGKVRISYKDTHDLK